MHEAGCPHARLSNLKAYAVGCRCRPIVDAKNAYQRAHKAATGGRAGARARAAAGTGRRRYEVDRGDVTAAIVSYANRGLTVPATLTLAERKLVVDWFERERPGTGARTIAAIVGLSDQTIVRMRNQRREAAPV